MSKTKKPEMTVVAEDKCKSDGCKKASTRFTFCDEHYEWFKFGLVTKVGKQVPDFEKKYQHFLSHQSQYATRKTA